MYLRYVESEKNVNIICDVISFFITRKCQNIKNSSYLQRKSSYLLNNWRNFDEVFRKDLTYDNIKSHEKPESHPFLRRCIFGKTQGMLKRM